jgi:hypothetical protein
MKRDPLLLGMGAFTAIVPTAYLFFSVTFLFAIPLAAGIATFVWGLSPSSRKKHIIGIGVCIIATFGAPGLVVFGNRPGRPIKLVIPNDFVGEIRIYRDVVNGIPPEQDETYWIYRLGDDGTLVTSNDRPFYRWHKMRAEFRDGRVILDYSTDTHQNYGYHLRDGGTRISSKDPRRTHRWTLERIDANLIPVID